jgi:DNA-binding NarL/FixJ family response regulator
MAAKILLVDDSAAIRHALRFCIETQTDCEVCGEAENGKAAVEMVQQLQPDVIILDLSMPVMNGLEAAKRIRMITPDPYILLFTLQTYPQLVEDAQKAGINRVLSKSTGLSPTVVETLRSLPAA